MSILAVRLIIGARGDGRGGLPGTRLLAPRGGARGLARRRGRLLARRAVARGDARGGPAAWFRVWRIRVCERIRVYERIRAGSPKFVESSGSSEDSLKLLLLSLGSRGSCGLYPFIPW